MNSKGRIQFDQKRIKEIITRENKFIVDLWKILPLQHQPGNSTVDQEVLTNKDRPGGMFHGGKSRAKTVAELLSRLEEMKGKKLQYKERLVKKGLKNRLIKKKRKEDRKVQKTLATISQQKSAFKEIEKKEQKPVFNSEGRIVFSKFDFTVSDKDKKNKEPKDRQVILKRLEEQKERLQRLEEEGQTEKAAIIKAKQDWKTAMKRAEGVKVKDDPQLLKKSVRKEMERKKRSEKKWKKREETVQQMQLKKQEKRKIHIDERMKKRKMKQVKQLVKHGRLVKGVNI